MNAETVFVSGHAWLLLAVFLIAVLGCAKPLGLYIAHIMESPSLRFVAPMENAIYRLCGVRRDREMGWLHYTAAILLFNVIGVLFVFLIQILQAGLPLNPQAMANINWHSAFNTAVSFVTNTNWQGYGGESTMSYMTQMLALAVQNFLSAATGIVVVIALIRGLARHSVSTIGNAWVDLTRVTLFLLLPLSLLFALFLVSQGVIQNFSAYVDVATLEGGTQSLAMGPVASQEAIKMLGTNGGGFFNANSAHPFENPNALSNFFQMVSIFLIPAALCITLGRMVGDMRQGWTILTAMTVLFVVLLWGWLLPPG